MLEQEQVFPVVIVPTRICADRRQWANAEEHLQAAEEVFRCDAITKREKY